MSHLSYDVINIFYVKSVTAVQSIIFKLIKFTVWWLFIWYEYMNKTNDVMFYLIIFKFILTGAEKEESVSLCGLIRKLVKNLTRLINY